MAMEQQMTQVYAMAQRLYKLIYWTIIASIIVTVVFVVVPLVALLFELPSFIGTYTSLGSIGGF